MCVFSCFFFRKFQATRQLPWHCARMVLAIRWKEQRRLSKASFFKSYFAEFQSPIFRRKNQFEKNEENLKKSRVGFKKGPSMKPQSMRRQYPWCWMSTSPRRQPKRSKSAKNRYKTYKMFLRVFSCFFLLLFFFAWCFVRHHS